MRQGILFVLLAGLLCLPAIAQDYPKAEAFADYQCPFEGEVNANDHIPAVNQWC